MTAKRPSQRALGLARLVIVDDHELARAGLRSMLASVSGLEVVGEATNGNEAMTLCRELRPNLALIDVHMPGLNGLVTTRAIKQENPAISVIMVTMYDNPEYLLEALKAGASGYVLKDATRRELLMAVRRVLRGESILGESILGESILGESILGESILGESILDGHLLQRLGTDTSRSVPQPVEQLTLREREVLYLLAQGQTNREIARNLIVSAGTVKTHVEHIIAKLGVSDRTQAAVRALELGLIGTRMA